MKNMFIDNYDAKETREILKSWRLCNCIEDPSRFVQEQTQWEYAKCDDFAKKVINKGYVEVDRRYNSYQVTEKGIQEVCKHKFVKRLTKKKAEERLQQFIKRVEENNELPSLYKITKVYLFGSFLKQDKEDFGDLDFVVEYVQTFEDTDLQMEIEEEIAWDKSLNFISKMTYCRDKVQSFIKKRSPYIDIQPTWFLKNLEDEGEPFKEIFSFDWKPIQTTKKQAQEYKELYNGILKPVAEGKGAK